MTIEQQLARLDRRCRWLTCAVFILLAGVFLSAAANNAPPPPQPLRSELLAKMEFMSLPEDARRALLDAAHALSRQQANRTQLKMLMPFLAIPELRMKWDLYFNSKPDAWKYESFLKQFGLTYRPTEFHREMAVAHMMNDRFMVLWGDAERLVKGERVTLREFADYLEIPEVESAVRTYCHEKEMDTGYDVFVGALR